MKLLSKVAADVVRLENDLATLRDAVRKIRDTRGDDRCWRDYDALFALLPEGYTPPARDTTVELEMCKEFIRCSQDPRTEYVSPQRRIAELEAELAARTLPAEMLVCNPFWLPWTFVPEGRKGTCDAIKDVNGVTITNDEQYYPGAPSAQQMEFIVECVNRIGRDIKRG